MLNVIYFIYQKEKIQVSWIYDPYNNELIDPKTGESNFLSKPSYKSVFEMKQTSDYKFIKRTF